MAITEVIEAERVRGKYRILLDSGDKYWLTKAMYDEKPVRAGEEVDSEAFARWVTLHQYRPALERAVAMLATRACSKGEISQKLRTAGYSPDTIEMVLAKLDQNDLLDDRAFGEQWAHYRHGQKYGPRKIAAELRQKGLTAEEAEAAVSSLDDQTQAAQAEILARKGLSRRKKDEDFRKTKQRVLAGIVRRGFDWETAREAIDRAAEDLENGDE